MWLAVFLPYSLELSAEVERVRPKLGLCEKAFRSLSHLKGVGPTARYLAASPLIREVEVGRSRDLIQQASFEQDIAGVDFEEAREVIASWMKTYSAYADRRADLEKARKSYTLYLNELKLNKKNAVSDEGDFIFLENVSLVPSIEKSGDVRFPPPSTPQRRSLRISRSDLDVLIRQAEKKIKSLEQMIRLLNRTQAIHQWRLELLLQDLDPRGHFATLSETRIQNLQEELGEDLFSLAKSAHDLLTDRSLRAPIEFRERIQDVLKADEITQRIMLRKMLKLGAKSVQIFDQFWDKAGQQIDRWAKPFRTYLGFFILVGHVGALYLVVNSQILELRNELIQTDEERLATEEAQKLKELQDLVFSIAGETTSWAQFQERFRAHIGRVYPDESNLIWAEYRNGLRESLEEDGQYEAFYFQKAKEIEDLFQTLLVGKFDKEGRVLVPGAADRMQRREQITDLLDEIFLEIETQGADTFIPPALPPQPESE